MLRDWQVALGTGEEIGVEFERTAGRDWVREESEHSLAF